jgi:hypothetical protein
MVVDVLVFLGHGLAQVVPLCPLCHHPQPSGGCCGGEARRRNAGAIPGLAAAVTAWALPQHAVASAPRRMYVPLSSLLLLSLPLWLPVLLLLLPDDQ